MAICVESGSLVGIKGIPVRVEVDLLRKLPSVVIVGLPSSSVRESTDRVRSALKSIGAEFPRQRVVVNLAPGDLPKSGTAFDLPIALGILAASGQVPADALRDTIFVGEVSLDGQLRPIRGALSLAMMARRLGAKQIVLPKACASEAAELDQIDVRVGSTLAEVVSFLRGTAKLPSPHIIRAQQKCTQPDLREVRGQFVPRRAMELAAAGGHNLIFVGPPGCGKTMLASRVPGILPQLSIEESLDITRIYSAAGLLPAGIGLIQNRPFRAPHHSISRAGLMGGAHLRPSELVLAHHGVLFLDEIAEFAPSVLEMLRVPLEQKQVTISRSRGSIQFPCNVSLIASANPCPCGFLGHPTRVCICGDAARARYRRRFSGPLMDRMDLKVWVQPVETKHLSNGEPGEPSACVRDRVEEARERQRERYRGLPWRCNAELQGDSIRQHCHATQSALDLLQTASEHQQLSARAWTRLLKVARTAADLEKSPTVEPNHIAEAASYRIPCLEDVAC